ncbi:MAG: class I SAM-dependent methyltransferase [Paraglaciecola sp.]|nr:class I SAM-dependent methyltransferase [Paraglaciecola sp.]NCT47446.1 class I SAM-dependent methyltransferase [Paraglaciecola sp.]
MADDEHAQSTLGKKPGAENGVNLDAATAYELYAREFLRQRDASNIGAEVIGEWATCLHRGASVLEVACGGGEPITRELQRKNLKLWAIDSAKTLVTAFQQRFPDIPIRCERFQDSDFFGQRFDAAVAVGLIFLLAEDEQKILLQKMSSALKPHGHLLFSAPSQVASWRDLSTGIDSLSLGHQAYVSLLKEAGMRLLCTYQDRGGNHYYAAQKIGA